MAVILVADALAAIREPIAAALQGEGYETLCAADTGEALALAATHKPDLIILDGSLPAKEGVECLAALRRRRATADVPVILLSGGVDRRKVAQAAKLKVRDFLLKSEFSLPELLKRVRQRIEESAAGPSPSAPAGVPPPQADDQPEPEVLFDRHLRKPARKAHGEGPRPPPA